MLSRLPRAAAYMRGELPRGITDFGTGLTDQLAQSGEVVVADGKIERIVLGC